MTTDLLRNVAIQAFTGAGNRFAAGPATKESHFPFDVVPPDAWPGPLVGNGALPAARYQLELGTTTTRSSTGGSYSLEFGGANDTADSLVTGILNSSD